MLRGTRPLLRLSTVAVLFLVAACSLINREGPDVSCADLQNGATNACADGIIATCTGGSVTYKVCEQRSACSAPWQTSGRYRCTETEPPPNLVASVPGEDGSNGSGSDSPSDGGGANVSDASSTPAVDASDSGPVTCEACVQSKCSTQLASCLGNGNCNAVYQCLLACTDKTCGNNCIDTALKASDSYSIRSCVGGDGIGPGCKAQCPAWP